MRHTVVLRLQVASEPQEIVATRHFETDLPFQHAPDAFALDPRIARAAEIQVAEVIAIIDEFLRKFVAPDAGPQQIRIVITSCPTQ
jgi:hypothetical protein